MCDIFVLLLGREYGTLVPDGPRSFTEMEYETAIDCPKIGGRIHAWALNDGDKPLPSGSKVKK